MRIVLAVLFAVFSLVHLYACYFKLNRLRAATKPGLLLLLAVFYAAYAPLWKPTVFLALLFGMAGDILLITNGRQARFVVGAVCFSIGHILYSYTLYYMTGAFAESPGLWLPLALALPYAAAVALVARGLFPYIRERHLRALMPVYLGLVGVVNVGAWLTFLAALRADLQIQAFAGSLLVPGALLFLVSDTVLACSMFMRKPSRANFWVMLTYISAQALLTAGFMLYFRP